jgi:hypothetical protein
VVIDPAWGGIAETRQGDTVCEELTPTDNNDTPVDCHGGEDG